MLQAREGTNASKLQSIAGQALKAIPTDTTTAVGQASQTDVLAIVADHTGAPRAMVDDQKKTVWRAEVKGFGEAVLGKYNQATLNLRGSSQYFDEETQLHYNRHRYLDAHTGRYLSADPSGLAGGLNLYAFADNNPIANVDPLGLQAKPTNTNVSGWSFAEKLTVVIKLTAQASPQDVASELLALVSPAKVATTTAVIGLWAASHAYGVGEIVDAFALAYVYYTLGKGATDLITGMINTTLAINNAQCENDLRNAANTLSKAIGNGTSALVEATVLRKVFSNPETVLSKNAVRQLEDEVNAGRGTKLILPPPPRLSLSELVGKKLSSGYLSNVGRQKNDGALGEQIAAQLLEKFTGAKFRNIQNKSGNGADLVRINTETKTIEHIEVKSSQVGKPGWPQGDLNIRFNDWIKEAVTGRIAGKPI